MDEEDRLRFDRIFGTAKRFDEELRTSPLDPLDKADVCVIMLTDLLKESYGYAGVEAVDHVLTKKDPNLRMQISLNIFRKRE
jgi:hypothetical protein